MIRVLVIQAQMKQYRLPFFTKLHAALLRDGIKLRVAYSDPHRQESLKGDNVDLPQEFSRKIRGYWFFGNRLLYQSVWPEVSAADLVIVEQANKHLINHVLVLSSALGLKKVAFWGHGRNRQSRRGMFSGWLKERTLNHVDWWFAYTAGTADYLMEYRVPLEKITNVQNSIDTRAFREELSNVTASDLASTRRELGIQDGSKVGLFCGGITREKMPGFLVESAAKIKERHAQFEVLAIGAGPEQVHFERAGNRYPWFHYLGPRFGREKAIYFKLSDAFLMPGLVGLAILDAFAAGLPIVTTRFPYHSPEIEYLRENQNGLMTSCDVHEYASATVRLLKDPSALRRLQDGARSSAQEYSIEVMVERFRLGILKCLGISSPAVSKHNLTVREERNSSRIRSEA